MMKKLAQLNKAIRLQKKLLNNLEDELSHIEDRVYYAQNDLDELKAKRNKLKLKIKNK